MEFCIGFFGISFYLIQAVLALVVLLFIFPLIAVKIAVQLKLKSVNWLIIWAWIEIYCVMYICYNKNYLNLILNYLPDLVCRNIF